MALFSVFPMTFASRRSIDCVTLFGIKTPRNSCCLKPLASAGPSTSTLWCIRRPSRACGKRGKTMNTSHSQETPTGEAPGHVPLRLASATQTLPPSATLSMNEAVAKRRAAGRETIHLGFGEAAFPLHPLLRTALAEAATHTSYAPVLGIPALRQAIAAYLARKRGLTCSADHIAVGPGSKPLLYALLHILEGDVLLPVPSWVSYAPMARLAGRRVIGVQTEPHDHHRLTPQALAQAMTRARKGGANPRILLVNSPSNPTGSMFDRADVEALACWAREAEVTLISDEIYAELAHGWREHISPAHFYPEGCIVTGGLSKAFSAGGWRLGYAALPPTTAGKEFMQALRALASEIWSTTATPLQEAALAAFTPHATIEQYVHRSALVHGYVAGQLYTALTRLGVPCPRPAGGFYLYPDFSPWRPALWSLLDQAETLQLTNEKRHLSLPALERAQARLTEMIHALGQPGSPHVQ